MEHDPALRKQLQQLLEWNEAHAGFEQAVAELDPQFQGQIPAGLPHSPWQLLEHLRRTQRDILEFCRNPGYVELRWPEDYWPSSPAPPTGSAWHESVAEFLADRKALRELAGDPGVDLFARIPHGKGQTYLREILLVADHTSHHVGQLILVRRCLGAWGRE